MASLMDSYEQQYSTLTAEITSKIGRIPNLVGSKYFMSSFPVISIFRGLELLVLFKIPTIFVGINSLPFLSTQSQD